MLLFAGCGRAWLQLDDEPSADAATPEAGSDASTTGEGGMLVGMDSGMDAAAIGADANMRCDPRGTWAFKLTMQVSWPAGSGLSAGSGTGELWLRMRVGSTGVVTTDESAMCGLTLPDVQAGDTRYGLLFQDSLFAAGSLSAATPTGFSFLIYDDVAWSFTTGNSALLLGARLNDPVNSAWPPNPDSVDVDNDGKGGVTAAFKASPFGYPFVSLISRADRAYLAARLVHSMQGTMTCNRASGTAVLPRFDWRVLGCALADRSRDCLPGIGLEVSMLDAEFPSFEAPVSATVQGARLEDGASCAAVRTALP